MNRIPYGKHHITEDDIRAVVKTLRSEYLTQGPKVDEFEQKFAQFTGCKYAIATMNGTAALHLSALALGITPGDKVLTTPITFAASANCVIYAGGKVDFVDIDKESFLIDLNRVEDKLKKNKPGTYTCIIPVDFAGYPVRLDLLRDIADKYGCRILEDACHAPGAYYTDKDGNRQACGNCNYADAAVFSFHPVKHIATGEGGMVTTNNRTIYEKIKLLRTHGITKDPEILEENHGGWYYEMQELGYNYRIPDILCALGISQLQKIDKNLEQRNKIAQKYNNAFQNHPGIPTPVIQKQVFHAYHLYVILTDERKGLYNYLKDKNIFTQVHYIPLHMQPYYRHMGWKRGDFPVAEAYYERCLSLPIYPSLSEEEQQYVIDAILGYFS